MACERVFLEACVALPGLAKACATRLEPCGPTVSFINGSERKTLRRPGSGLTEGECALEPGNPAGANNARGLVDVKGGNPLCLLIESDVSFETEGISLRI